MDQAVLDQLWETRCADIRGGIGMGCQIGIARVKGKTAAEAKADFFSDLARIAFDRGVAAGIAAGASK